MSSEDLIGLLVVATFFGLWALEAVAPARSFPHPRFRRVIGLASMALLMLVSALAPLAIPASWLEQHRLLDGSGLGVVGGAIVGYLVLSFVNYLWHRNMHRVSLLWRLFHQLHHAPRHVDMASAAIFHPLEMAAFALLALVTTTLVLGLHPLAAAITGYIAAFYSLFQHCNIRTPAWLGYLIQRPESHCVHHQRGVHHYNFSDLPLWDIVFGTFRNPPSWRGEAGFEPHASARWGAMLAFHDVNAAEYGRASLGVKDPAALPPA